MASAGSVHDVLAPGGGGSGGDGSGVPGQSGDLVAAAGRVAAQVLAPAAAATDQAPTVPVGHLAALAEAGLLGLMGPTEDGGSAARPPVVREVFETLAAACGVTFFVWVQHHAPVRMLARSPNTALRRELLPGLCAGAHVGGVAFAHLRRPEPPLVAVPAPGGYLLRGEAPWVTSWGLADTFAVAARIGAHGVVFLAVGGHERRRATASPPLRLAAMNASSTVRLRFDDLLVGDDRVILELPLEEWQEADRVATAQPNPAAFAVAGACTTLLADLDAGTASCLEEERLDLRRESYGLADEGGAGEQYLSRLVDLRAHSLELAVRAAHALVAATGGRSMELSHPAQRLLREAAFYAIQAQTPALRAATLRRLQTIS